MQHVWYPRNPNKVLTTAFQLAMSATLALAKVRATGKARPLYFGRGERIKGMTKIWEDAKEEYKRTVQDGAPDASVLLKAESNIRRNFSRIMLKTSVKYGNTETKRIKREKENQQYLNKLWDYAGSTIRNVFKVRYKFPRPGKITLRDGKIGTGFPGSAKSPMYQVRHNHLVEMDFGDMIRSHLMELGRQCLKYGVPLKEAKRYIDELSERLLPFVDYVYTEKKVGRPNFVRESIKELRIVVEQIRNHYGTRNGRAQSITSAIAEKARNSAEIQIVENPDDDEVDLEDIDESEVDEIEEIDPDETNDFFKALIKRARKDGMVLDSDIKQLKKLLKKKFLTEEDAGELLKKAVDASRRIGVVLHDYLSDFFPTPFKLSAVVHHGDEMIYDTSGLLLTSELYVAAGRGRADLVLFRRKFLSRADNSPPRVVYEPCMVIDIKTKTAFDLDLYGMDSRSKGKKHVVSEFVLERRRLTDGEWKGVLAATPDKDEIAQLGAYSEAILSDYRSTMWYDSQRPTKLIQAIVVVDAKENWEEMGKTLLQLVLEAYHRGMKNKLPKDEFLQPKDQEVKLRMGLRVVSSSIARTTVRQVDRISPSRPFKNRRDDGKDFTLYLSVAGRGSPSHSAAEIAAKWHGLQYIQDIAKNKARDVMWIDLIGEFVDPILTKLRLRLKYQDASIQRFFKKRVQMIDFSSDIKEFLYNGRSLKDIRTKVRSLLKNKRRPIVIVSGWEFLRRGTPKNLQNNLDTFVKLLIDEFPRSSNIVWFARPVPIAQNNILYRTRCVAPFYTNTHWGNHVDEIVWNLPLPPYRMGSLVPADDHKRILVIERHDASGQKPKLIDVDVLRGWGEDFRQGKDTQIIHYQLGGGIVTTGKSMRVYDDSTIEDALGLLPHIKNAFKPLEESIITFDYEIVSAKIDMTFKNLDSMSNRMRLRIFQTLQQIESDDRVKLLVPMTRINQKREYRTMDLDVSLSKRSIRPPSEGILTINDVDDLWIARREYRSLLKAIDFLSGSGISQSFLSEISSKLYIDETMIHVSDVGLMNQLRTVQQVLETNEVSMLLWQRLWETRHKIPKSLNSEQRDHVGKMLQKHPDLLHLVGNHLFLVLLAALEGIQHTLYAKTIDSLWEYISPWYFMGLGLRPKYSEGHRTGKSVLDRHKLLMQLKQRALQLNSMIEKDDRVTEVRFGQVIIPDGATNDLWLAFQRHPSGREMNVALLHSRYVEDNMTPYGRLKSMVSKKTYWSESDLALLSDHAKLSGNEDRLSIMICKFKGLQLLFALDKKNKLWLPICRIDYSTHRFEDVTLVRTITLRREPHINAVSSDNMIRFSSVIKDQIDASFLIVNRGLEGCRPVTCHVFLDKDEGMYKIIFKEKDDNQRELAYLLIHRTADLLELLRRPDFECEPVAVNGQKFIWNRFEDIVYHTDVELIRPWVDRSSPFRYISLDLPLTARALLSADRLEDLELELVHNHWTCPSEKVSLDTIRKERKLASTFGNEYFTRFESLLGQPEIVSNEPGIHHGSCWRIKVHSRLGLPEEVKQLMDIRLTAAQIISLLSSKEIAYKSKDLGRWCTHSFTIRYAEGIFVKAQESWHFRKFLHMQGLGLKRALVPGSYREPDTNWEPYFIINPESVIVGLVLTSLNEEREIIEHYRGLGLRDEDDVQNYLESLMNKLLEEYSMQSDRKLRASIAGEIKAAMEIAGVGRTQTLTYEGTLLHTASFGGQRYHAVFISDGDTEYEFPITPWFHEIDEQGSILRSELEDFIHNELDELELKSPVLDEILKHCIRDLRNRGYKISRR